MHARLSHTVYGLIAIKICAKQASIENLQYTDYDN